MKGPLGILVATDAALDHLLGVVAAAERQGVAVKVFFTGDGVRLTQDSRFAKLAGRAKMALCEVSFRAQGLTGDVPGLGFKDFATQAKNAEMLEDCPHYLVL
jgi:predicted peroxiredoxin